VGRTGMGKKIVVLTGLVAIGSMFATPALTHHRSRGYYESYRPYPVACEAVMFPRSPLCAGRPAYYPFWWTPPFYNWFAYY
jgi:hypothetical protein